MGRPSILLIGELVHCNAEWEAYGSKFTLQEFIKGTREQFLLNCQQGMYDDVVALYRSNQSTSETGPFDKELVLSLPKSLEYIYHNGAGYDNIDVAVCTQRGIKISSTPMAVDNATADVGVFLMLGSLRQAFIPLTAIRGAKFRGETPIGHDPEGKVLGILGMGGIGRALAHRARAFGMQIVYHNRKRLPEDSEGGAKYLSFDDLLAQSDVLSLNLTLNAKTKHIISKREFGKMKDGAVIINTARGALINEKDLVEALESGKLASVGLDVFENEPKIEEGLLKNDRAFILPHIGTNTFETQREMELLTLRNMEQAVETGKLLTLVPEQKSGLSGHL